MSDSLKDADGNKNVKGNTMSTFTTAAVAAGLLAATLAGHPAAAQAPDGTTQGRPGQRAPAAISGPISPSGVFTKAQYATGGAGLRNRGGAGIDISGVIGPVRTAYLYWAFITNGTPPSADSKMTISRRLPGPVTTATVQGYVIGTGASPCWGGTQTTVYRASVPVALASGNGAYDITLQPGAGGSTAGGDPWNGTLLYPLAEGASLLIVGTGTQTVALFDKGLAGNTFSTTLNYTLKLPVPTTGSAPLLDSIGADGQNGHGREQTAALSGEVTKINGVVVSGPGGSDLDSDWNGSSALPLPGLWDDVGHTISASAPGGTTSLAVSIQSNTDCLVPVANITAE